jgi:hypothetical protein
MRLVRRVGDSICAGGKVFAVYRFGLQKGTPRCGSALSGGLSSAAASTLTTRGVPLEGRTGWSESASKHASTCVPIRISGIRRTGFDFGECSLVRRATVAGTPKRRRRGCLLCGGRCRHARCLTGDGRGVRRVRVCASHQAATSLWTSEPAHQSDFRDARVSAEEARSAVIALDRGRSRP